MLFLDFLTQNFTFSLVCHFFKLHLLFVLLHQLFYSLLELLDGCLGLVFVFLQLLDGLFSMINHFLQFGKALHKVKQFGFLLLFLTFHLRISVVQGLTLLLDQFVKLVFMFFSLSIDLFFVFFQLSEQHLILAFDASQPDFHVFFELILFETVRLPFEFLLSD